MGLILRTNHINLPVGAKVQYTRLTNKQMDNNFIFLQNLVTGLQGPEGPQGTEGPQGPVGPTGSGLQGPTGSQGEIGPQGPTGSQGEIGPQGPTGSQGEIGPQGPQGTQGLEGPVGVSGLTWKGSWDSNSLYDKNDAVGYASASWWCVATVSSTASVIAPDLDTTHINWTLLAAQGSQGPQGPQGLQGTQGLQGPTGPSSTNFSYGTVEALTSFPYPLLSYKVNSVYCNDSIPIYRVSLPTFTAEFGDKVTVLNSGDYMFSVTAAIYGPSKIYINGINGVSVFEFYVFPNQQYDFIYFDEGKWLCQAVQSKLLLEYTAPLYQQGTASPIPQSPVIDTLSVGQSWTGDYYRDIEFTREGVGKYKIWIKWKNVDTNSNKLGIMFGDGICVADGNRSNGTLVDGSSYTSFDFSTYTPGGTASDDLLKGYNSACFTVKLYQ